MNNFDIIDFTQKLIRIESTDPGTYESDIKDFLQSQFNNLPEGCVIYSDPVFPKRSNLMVTLPSSTNEPELILICHMDTVPIGSRWTKDPLGGQIIDNKLYGRGACDMKSGLACAYSAFMSAVKRFEKNEKLTRGLRLVLTVDEEDEMNGSEHAITSGWIPSDAWVLDTEPTHCSIQSGHKGRLWFKFHVRGAAAHASTPWKGADAIAGAAELISSIRRRLSHLPSDNYFGESTMCFGTINGGLSPYAVPADCTFTVDMRLVPPADSAIVVEEINQICNDVMDELHGIIITYDITGDRRPIPYYPQSPLLQNLILAYEDVSHEPATVQAFTGYTDSAVISAFYANHNCLSFGPGNLEQAHRPDEYVSIKELKHCEKVLHQLVNNLCFNN